MLGLDAAKDTHYIQDVLGGSYWALNSIWGSQWAHVSVSSRSGDGAPKISIFGMIWFRKVGE